MSNKSQACYEHAFKHFDENVFRLSCVSFTTDYERGMRNALRSLFPESRLFACYFHFCQAVKKRAYKTNHLVALMKSNESARSIYYRLLCLPLLPANYISEMFAELKTEAYGINKSIFRPFMRYFYDQWLVKVFYHLLFYTYVPVFSFFYLVLLFFVLFSFASDKLGGS